MNLPEYIINAVHTRTNYSGEFTKHVAFIAKMLFERMGFTVRIDSDMNYRAGQSLILNFSDKYPYLPSENGSIEVRIYISSKAKLFAFYCFDMKRKFIGGDEPIHPASIEKLPEQVRSVIEACRKFLIENGYKEVEKRLFDEIVPDYFTELDDLPATVFQALFAEIV